ncbi:PHP domain-containing protein [Brevibacillus massiliensis]|uniref:PHP domain-containing protein n=1 Tax=Brevibacillus massiliensis TaxID=1118054 RepID=UPI0004750841|nr:PHP domain-containing protein [Brevibacillus massiliensis]
MNHRADLHTHTKASDGTCTPRENVRLAKEAGLAAVAITDHDIVAGIAEAVEAGREWGVEVVPGVEISSSADGQDIHVLGYFIPYQSEAFQESLSELRKTRFERNRLMIERLQELGFAITLEDVYRRKQGADKNIGRPHIAEEMVERGYVASMQEAFDKYLGKGGLAYVNPPRISPQQAIDLIRQSGGVAVLAHPGLYGNDVLVRELIRYGLDGIEVWHPDNDEAAVDRYRKLADECGLIQTGGSDFHGWRGGEPYHAMLGSSTADHSAVVRLRQLAEQRQGTLSGD